MDFAVFFGLLIAISANLCHSASVTARAKAEIFLASDFTKKIGEISLVQYDNNGPDYVMVTGDLTQITPEGKHGFHVHSKASTSQAACSDLGPHFNPLSHNHAAPTAIKRHVGDLGNIVANASGSARIDIEDRVIQIGTGEATHDVIGKSLAIHVGTDDLGLGGHKDSLRTGNAGPFLACGTIVEVGAASLQSLNLFLLLVASLIAMFN